MKQLHEKLLEQSRMYLRWHEDSLHTVVHWLAFFAIAVLATVFIQFDINNSVSEISAESQVASPFSAGRIIGVSENRLLIGFKDDVPQTEKVRLLKDYGLKERGNIPELNVHMYQIAGKETPEEMTALLMQKEQARVDFVEPDYLVEPSVVPNDPWYTNWQKDKVQMNAPAAWDIMTDASGVLVAVLDTGMNCTHEDLVANCVPGKNIFSNGSDTSDLNGHGTAVAGVIGATGNNGTGVTGGVWEAKLMPVVVAGANGAASYSTIASAISYAADNGARVVNNSYQSGGSLAVQRAAKYLWGKGGILVVAEGNYATNSGTADSPYIISVGAIDSTDALYSWSSYGKDTDVVAPGCTGATTAVGGGYGSFCGTSNAAPEVASLLALIFALTPALTPDDASAVLFSSSVDLGSAGRDIRFGWGKIDMAATLQTAQTHTAGQPVPTGPKGKPR